MGTTRSALSRREMLKLGAATAAAVGTVGAGSSPARAATHTDEVGGRLPAGTDQGAYEILANAYGFGVDIPGCAAASKNIREIHIDELKIDERQQSSNSNGGAGVLASFTIGFEPVGASQFHDWFDQAQKGASVRKDISVVLFKRDRTPGRGYVLFGCSPIAMDCVNFDDTSSTVQTEKLTVKVGRIEFKTWERRNG
jgi:hypothetical protein